MPEKYSPMFSARQSDALTLAVCCSIYQLCSFVPNKITYANRVLEQYYRSGKILRHFVGPATSAVDMMTVLLPEAFTHPLGGFLEVGVTGSIVLATYRIGKDVLYVVGWENPSSW
jgi:hypothetical protein